MAKVSHLKTALTGAAVAGMLMATVVPSQAGLWAERFAALKGSSQKSSSLSSTQSMGWKWSLVQYRANKYDQRISKFLGRQVSPFCRFFC